MTKKKWTSGIADKHGLTGEDYTYFMRLVGANGEVWGMRKEMITEVREEGWGDLLVGVVPNPAYRRQIIAIPAMLEALRMVEIAYEGGPDPLTVRLSLDVAIDFVREALELAGEK